MSATSGSSRFLLKGVLILVVLAAGAIVAIHYLRPVATVEPVVSGEAIDAKPGSVTVMEEYDQDLTSEIGGRVLAKDYNLSPGNTVKKGEILAQLDPGDTQLAMRQQEIDLTATKAGYEADHSKELALESEDADLANDERLNKMGMFSDKDLAQFKRQEETLRQSIEMEKITHKQTLDTLANGLAIDQRQLDEMTIRSPMDGIVSLVYAHPGDLIAKDAPVARLITSNKVVEGKISEEDFAQIAVGEDANVTFLPYGDQEFPGKIVKILPTADPETQRHLVHIAVTMDAAHPLQPGINGEVIIIVGRRPAKAVVPRRAVFQLDGNSVFVVRDGVVELRKVEVGYDWSRGAEILSGLEPGEKVIVDQLENFNAGDHVRVSELPSDVFHK